ncbi:MAG: MipA/OmpV family protein [Gammaproteobacteria bacterium]
MRGTIAPIVLAVATWSCATVAQEQIGLDATEPLDLDPPPEVIDEQRDFDVRLGMLGAVGPEFEGSDSYEIEDVPYARISYRERLIFRGRSLELNVYRTDGIRFGPIVQTRAGRDEDNDRILEGFGDVDRAFEAGGFVRGDYGPLRFRVEALHDVSGAHDGMLVEFGGGVQVPWRDPWFVLRVRSTWADGDYTSTFYGVSERQAQRSGLRAFDADAGFKDVQVSVATRVPLSKHFSALFSAGYTRLLGDVADSPIVADHGSANQFFAAGGLAWRY